jgi:hypothetical protein
MKTVAFTYYPRVGEYTCSAGQFQTGEYVPVASVRKLLEAAENALHVLTPAHPEMDGLDRTRMWLREAITELGGTLPRR